jgi:hypothetical protein
MTPLVDAPAVRAECAAEAAPVAGMPAAATFTNGFADDDELGVDEADPL